MLRSVVVYIMIDVKNIAGYVLELIKNNVLHIIMINIITFYDK